MKRAIRKYSYFFISFCCLIHFVHAQEIPTVVPEEVGLSSARLKRLDSVIQGIVKRGELASPIILIARRGKIAHFKAYGQIDIKAKKKMPPDAIFPIGSNAKIISGAAVLMLYEEGHFLLSDPISRFIPEFKNMKVIVPSKNGRGADDNLTTVPAEGEITIRDLLRHTAGFTYGSGKSSVDKLYREAGFRTWNGTLAGFVKQLSKFPLAYHPGKKWEYSYSIDVLGYLIEVISGQSLDQFMKQRIFKPLDMKDTDFYVPKDKLDRFTNFYKFENGSLRLEESVAQSSFRKRPSAFSAGGGWGTGYGGLVTTARDFARFLQMILDYGKLGKKRLLSRKSIELMKANHIKDIPGYFFSGAGYGLGVGVTTDIGKTGELATPGEIYWAGAPNNTSFFVDFKEEMFGILLTQTAPFGHLGLIDRVKILSLQAIDD